MRLAHGEIDLIADDGGCLVLVEVRLRHGKGAGPALESVGRWKQARLRRLAKEYCAHLREPPPSVRIDVVGVAVDRQGGVAEVVLVQNAVEDD